MQLNTNNDRYYSSRGIDRDDDDWDDEDEFAFCGSNPKAKFKGHIGITEFLPYFKSWIKNWKINTGKSYITTNVINGLTIKGCVGHFVGFNCFDKEQAVTWGYYRTRALIDYLTDKQMSWTMYRGEIIEYRVDWSNFGYRPENIMWANRFIYEQNGLDFPNEEEVTEMFLMASQENLDNYDGY
jgi:hypothetical protein